VIGPVAAAVALSRVYTGVHYPSDVVVGGVIGTTVALLSRIPWPRVARLVHAPHRDARAGSDSSDILAGR
jgi:membrane-associated phospholipid phosphatase